MRQFVIAAILTTAGFVGSAHAQFVAGYPIYPSPWQPQLVWHPPVNFNTIQYLGTLPNGTRVINPWNMYNNNNYPAGFYYWQPPLFNPWQPPLFYSTAYYNYNPYYSGYTPGIANPFSVPRSQLEVGRLVLAGPNFAINPVSGTVVQPLQGIAYTREGTFYRLPGTLAITAWGAPIPGSGTYYNPMTGALYQPGNGLIVRQ